MKRQFYFIFYTIKFQSIKFGPLPCHNKAQRRPDRD